MKYLKNILKLTRSHIHTYVIPKTQTLLERSAHAGRPLSRGATTPDIFWATPTVKVEASAFAFVGEEMCSRASSQLLSSCPPSPVRPPPPYFTIRWWWWRSLPPLPLRRQFSASTIYAHNLDRRRAVVATPPARPTPSDVSVINWLCSIDTKRFSFDQV